MHIDYNFFFSLPDTSPLNDLAKLNTFAMFVTLEVFHPLTFPSKDVAPENI